MQRSYVFYFQLLLQAAFFGSLYASKSEVKHINDQEDEFENYRSIPAGVHCTEFALIYRDYHTVTVCVGGSVKMDKWIDSALSLQRLLSYRRDICTTQIIGSKSSGNSMFYGYGATDHLYPNKSSGNYYQTSSQLFSIRDQLQLGVRFLELNVHFVQNAIKIANCNVNGESGCKEEYNGVPVENFQPVGSLLKEIADWLKSNRNEFVFVIFNGDEDLNNNNQVGTLIGHVRENFIDSMIYRPLDRPNAQSWPTTFDLLKKGKQIMFLTELDYSAHDLQYFFLKKSVCNWIENTPPLSDFPSCKFKKSGINAKKLYDNIDQVVSSELHFGEKDSNGYVGWNMYPLNETRIPNMVRCGVNVISPDNITPARMESMVWTLAPNTFWNQGECLTYRKDLAVWLSVDCHDIPPNTAAACQDLRKPLVWMIIGPVTTLEEAVMTCAGTTDGTREKLATMTFSIPATAYENSYFLEVCERSNYDSVLFNTDLLKI